MRYAPRSLFLLVATIWLMGAGEASAVSVSGPQISADFSETNLLSFDLDLPSAAFTAAVVELEGDSGPVTFNAAMLGGLILLVMAAWAVQYALRRLRSRRDEDEWDDLDPDDWED